MGGAWIYGIMITFIMIFVAYIAISLNYSKVFTAKTHIVNLIEQYQGLNDKSIAKIDRQLDIDGYRTLGTCTQKDTVKNTVLNERLTYGAGDFVGVDRGFAEFNGKNQYQYCVYKSTAYKANNGNNVDDYYYMVVTFLNFSFPILGNVYTLKISGETHAINYPNDSVGFWNY